MRTFVKFLPAIFIFTAVFCGCKKEGTILVKNNTRSTYEVMVTDNITYQNYQIIESKGQDVSQCYDVDCNYYLVATQKDGYFEHPQVVKDYKYLSKKGGAIVFNIESRPAYIKYVNITSDTYQVDITCAANSTIKQINMPGRTLDSLEVEAGFSYNLKFTQLDGYLLYPSTKEYTVNADCGYIYTYETPNSLKCVNDGELEEYEY